MKSLVEDLAFFYFLATLSHSLGFTALLLPNTVALILMYVPYIVYNLLLRPTDAHNLLIL